ncbi:MAG: fructose-bisphosphatase class II, partial [Bacilli bacterium]
IEHILDVVAKVTNKRIQDVTVIIQERPRHDEVIERIRAKGARVRLFVDGDVSAAITTALPDTGVDIFYGIGGAPEGVIAAAAIKCLEGDMQARLLPQNEEEEARCIQMGLENPHQILRLCDLVKGDDAIFAATGVSDGEMLQGVKFLGDDVAETHSIVMRAKTKTIRTIAARHRVSLKPYLQN